MKFNISTRFQLSRLAVTYKFLPIVESIGMFILESSPSPFLSSSIPKIFPVVNIIVNINKPNVTPIAMIDKGFLATYNTLSNLCSLLRLVRVWLCDSETTN